MMRDPKCGAYAGRCFGPPRDDLPSAGGDALHTVDCHFELGDDGHDDHVHGIEVDLYVVPGDFLAMF